MHASRIRLLVLIFIIFTFSFPIYCNYYNDDVKSNQESCIIQPQAINRTGKIFSNITRIYKNCYINRQNPSLNNQPKVFLPNYNISHARMIFENITVINYTKNIEDNPTEFIYSESKPLYIYQKFYVEIDQYINNVSIFIQDIIDIYNYTDENSWEVAILNCSDDVNGTPNSTIGVLQKQHPDNIAAHWEVFDFINSDVGPIFLDTSKTYHTIEPGLDKYWFAIRIKIPPDDTVYGGGPKFLYLNPDEGGLTETGQGDTFKFYENLIFENFSYNYVSEIDQNTPLYGKYIEGDLNSFKNIDQNRFIAEANLNNLTLDFYVNVRNSSYGTYDYLRNLDPWVWLLFRPVWSIDFELSTKISNLGNVENATLLGYNCTGGYWVDFKSVIDIKTDDETLITTRFEDALIIRQLLHIINTSDNNKMAFKFIYNGTGLFNVSFNKLSVNFGEAIQKNNIIELYDPLITELYSPADENIINGTGIRTDLLSLRYNDNDFYMAQADTNNLSIEFKFEVLPEINTSFWDVGYLDWLLGLYPYPYIPQIDFRISSNVSIDVPANLTLAVLEVYKGKREFDFLSPALNQLEWLKLTAGDLDFAFKEETSLYELLASNITWILMQLINVSDRNSLRFRLRYVGNGNFNNFNASVDEFILNFYIENIVNSDIASKIGFGLSNEDILPSNLQLKNFGFDVINNGIGNGIWEADIDFAKILQDYFEFNVTSLWYAIRFDVNGTYEIFKIEPLIQFVENPKSQYKIGTKYISVRVTEAGGNPIEKIEIVFEVLDGSGTPIYQSTGISDESGIAGASLKFTKTGERFSIRVSVEEQGMYASNEIVSGNIRIVDDLMIFLDNFIKYLPYIIIGLVAIGSIVALRYYKHAKSRKFWAEEAKILDDLLKISYIMIIHKEVGVSIYNRQISLEGIDSDLISGFLQAISQFRREIKREIETKSKGFEMDYYDFKIIINDGDYVRVALILDGSPSQKLKENQALFTEHFERRFRTLLKSFTGDISPFRETDDLIERYFNITLVYPLQLGKHYGVIKLKGLEKILVEVAEQIQKERKFFFVSSLLNFGLAGRKASRNEIISAIISLKKKEILVPVEME
ncbi:MAG: hypothetical protein ACFE9T_04850 [Promethearchaeota archaeon]